MLDVIDETLDALEQRRIGRREAVMRLAGVALAMAGGSGLVKAEDRPPSSTFSAAGLNHIALRVTDIPRARDFYVRHLGLSVSSESESSCFLDCGRENFVALFRSDAASLDHYCYTIEDYDPADVVSRLERAGLSPRRRENRVYFDDPDGHTVQIAGPRS